MSKRCEEAKGRLITRINLTGTYATVNTTAFTWAEIKNLHNFALDYMAHHFDQFAGYGFCTASNNSHSVARFCNDQEI